MALILEETAASLLVHLLNLTWSLSSSTSPRILLSRHLGVCIIPQLVPWDVGHPGREENEAELTITNPHSEHSIHIGLTLENFLTILVPQLPFPYNEG